MKEITIWLLCLIFAGLILQKVGSIVLYFKIRKHKKFLEFACPDGRNVLYNDYTHFRENFHALIKMLRTSKHYSVVSMFGQYLLAIKNKIDFELEVKRVRGIETADEVASFEKMLVEIGYTDAEWCLVCEAMDKDKNADEMMLKQLYWWPAFCLKFTGEKFITNSMKLLDVSDDNTVMNRIISFVHELRIFKNVQNHLGISEALKTNVLVMEKAFVKFLKDALQNKYLTFGDLQKIQKDVMTNSFVNDPYELSGEKSAINAEITTRIYRLKDKLQNSSTLV